MASGTVALQAQEYERVFAVLERCDVSTSVPDFAGRLLDALGTHFGLRHTTFFTGSSFHAAFADPSPLLAGHIPGMFPEYHAEWADRDGFDSEVTRRELRANRVVSLRDRHRCDEQVRGYCEDFLFRYGMYSATGMWLRLPGGRHALVGLFDEDPRRIGERELATLRRCSRQLDVISRNLPVEPSTSRRKLAALPSRQREVAALVAQGLTNAAIGRRLCLAEDTVKKYVSRLLAATGCRSRTELAVLVRGQA